MVWDYKFASCFAIIPMFAYLFAEQGNKRPFFSKTNLLSLSDSQDAKVHAKIVRKVTFCKFAEILPKSNSNGFCRSPESLGGKLFDKILPWIFKLLNFKV